MVVTSSWQYRIRSLILSCFGIISVSLGACQSSFLQQPLALDQDDLVKLMENKDCPGCNLAVHSERYSPVQNLAPACDVTLPSGSS